jgi:hypothetical protein
MITCRRASELISKSFDAPLTGAESLQVEEHGRVCPACVQHAREIEIIRRTCRELAAEALGDQGESLPEACRSRLQARLAESLQP